MTRIAELRVTGSPDPWRTLGLAVDDLTGRAGIGTLTVCVDAGDAPGRMGWTLWHAPEAAADEIDGLATHYLLDDPPPPDDLPALRVFVRVDHVVVATPDLARTVAALEAGLGEPCKRIRTLPTGSGANLHQAFFRLGEVVVEVVGPPEVDPDPRVANAPATFRGLVLVAADLDAVCERLGPELVSPPRPAVQAGRRIATVRRELGLGLPVALMD